MIYLVYGNDNKKKNAFVKKVSKVFSVVILESEDLDKESILSYTSANSLFGEKTAVIIEGLTKTNIEFKNNELDMLSKSSNAFILIEDKLLAPEVSKFKKFATIEVFNEEKATSKSDSKENFAIAESFGSRNKFKTWLTYKDLISKNTTPEEISGILFWKIKMLMTYQNKNFTKEELKKISSNLVSLYHDAHLGKRDFSIGLEQFILSSLNKNQKEKA